MSLSRARRCRTLNRVWLICMPKRLSCSHPNAVVWWWYECMRYSRLRVVLSVAWAVVAVWPGVAALARVSLNGSAVNGSPHSRGGNAKYEERGTRLGLLPAKPSAHWAQTMSMIGSTSILTIVKKLECFHWVPGRRDHTLTKTMLAISGPPGVHSV